MDVCPCPYLQKVTLMMKFVYETTKQKPHKLTHKKDKNVVNVFFCLFSFYLKASQHSNDRTKTKQLVKRWCIILFVMSCHCCCFLPAFCSSFIHNGKRDETRQCALCCDAPEHFPSFFWNFFLGKMLVEHSYGMSMIMNKKEYFVYTKKRIIIKSRKKLR